MNENKIRHLHLVTEPYGGLEGPITRLGLWYRFPPVAKGQLAFYISAKLILLSMLTYYVYG